MTETSTRIPWKDDSEPLTRDISRFARLAPDPAPVLPVGLRAQLEPRTSYQTITEGLHTPSWIQPDPYRPASLDEVCCDGNYRHESSLDEESDETHYL